MSRQQQETYDTSRRSNAESSYDTSRRSNAESSTMRINIHEKWSKTQWQNSCTCFYRNESSASIKYLLMYATKGYTEQIKY